MKIKTKDIKGTTLGKIECGDVVRIHNHDEIYIIGQYDYDNGRRSITSLKSGVSLWMPFTTIIHPTMLEVTEVECETAEQTD